MNYDMPTELLGKELPYSLEAEQTILGALLLEPDVLPIVIERLKPDCFFRPQHRELFSIVLRMFTRGAGADLVTVMNEAVMMGIFETPDMAKVYLKGIMEGVPSLANIADYCRIVEEKYYIRSLMNVAQEIIETASDGSSDARSLLDSAEQKIYDIRQGKDTDGLTRIDDIIVDAYSRLGKLAGSDRDKYLGTKTGFDHLDRITTGLNDSDLLILAARPGMGKSAFALNIATNMCKHTDKSVAIFSLEMGKEQLVTRMLSSEALVSNNALRSGRIDGTDWEKLAKGADSLSKMPIYLDDTAGITVPQMKAKLRRLKNLGFVIIDYLQLMSSPNKHNNRVTEVSEITRHLKLMAKELNVPVMTLSQLNRGAEGRTDHRPMLSDLRESGSIEQDADIILFLYRESYYNKEETNAAESECIIAKNRHGETGTVKLAWCGEYTLFRTPDFVHE
ncbi:MAG: replicative DNA helicase [Oscillospiraceae bacterium]